MVREFTLKIESWVSDLNDPNKVRHPIGLSGYFIEGIVVIQMVTRWAKPYHEFTSSRMTHTKGVTTLDLLGYRTRAWFDFPRTKIAIALSPQLLAGLNPSPSSSFLFALLEFLSRIHLFVTRSVRYLSFHVRSHVGWRGERNNIYNEKFFLGKRVLKS